MRIGVGSGVPVFQSRWWRVLACLVAAALISGCATVNAPYEFAAKRGAQATLSPGSVPDVMVLPPGTTVTNKEVRLLLEQDRTMNCLGLKIIEPDKNISVSAVYWSNIGRQATQIVLSGEGVACISDPKRRTRACLRDTYLKEIKDEIERDPRWKSCAGDLSRLDAALDAALPYHAKESLETDLGFVFLPTSKPPKRDTLSALRLRAGTKVCVTSEVGLTPSFDVSRVATAEQCQQFLAHDGGLAFPRFESYASSAMSGLANIGTTAEMLAVHNWLPVRSYAVDHLDQTFQATFYFTNKQSPRVEWTVSENNELLTSSVSGVLSVGPLLVVTAGTSKADSPVNRQFELSDRCGTGKGACFLFRDRSNVRVTYPLWWGQSVVDVDIGMTRQDFATAWGIPSDQVQVMRPYLGRLVPISGSGELVPLIPGDSLRRRND